jgi:contractile injection system tube protein
MSDLVKAELQVIDKNDKVTEKIPVQFNPTSMNLTMSNSTDGGTSRGRQAEQYNGSASTQLSLDLQFDTAEEGTSDSPVDVRTKTDKIRQFVLPGGTGSKQAPPRVRFEWGPFGLTGIMNSLTEELSLFSRDGVPLRSKMSIQIKEQDARFAALKSGPGANADSKPAAAGSGSAGAGPGSSGSGLVDRAVAALAGESPADFLARNGLDPEAWRGLGDALSALGDGLELSAGVSIGFDTTLSLGGGLEARGGVHVGLDAPASASLGLEASAGARASSASARAQGFALSSAGGVTSATEQAKTVEASGAQAAARTAFGGIAPAVSVATAAAGDRMPLAASGTVRRVAAGPAPAPAHADRRATTYGYGIPLRDRIEVPGAESDGYVVIGSRDPITASGSRPSGAPWGSLRSSRARKASDARSSQHTGCGCDGDPWSDRRAGCGRESGGAGCRCTSGR